MIDPRRAAMADVPTPDVPDEEPPDDWADPEEPEDDTLPEPGEYGDA